MSQSEQILKAVEAALCSRFGDSVVRLGSSADRAMYLTKAAETSDPVLKAGYLAMADDCESGDDATL
jgi:hypothetical protein